jgi:uncharacterized protein YdbL (DUF1318 family)
LSFDAGMGWNLVVNFLSTQTYFRRKHWLLGGFFLSAACLVGCSPTVNLATPNPVKVDIAVRLDVYQKTPPTLKKDEQSNLAIAANRRLRSGEIQQLKNDRIIGEDRDGYLDLRKPPGNPTYLAYAKGVVTSENADRSFLYLANAQAQSKPLEIIEGEYAKLWSDRAFPGEWIQKDDGTWTQK